MTMCGRHGLRLPRMDFICAAALAEPFVGRSQTLAESLAKMGIPYPGRPHDSLADARAAGSLALACWSRCHAFHASS